MKNPRFLMKQLFDSLNDTAPRLILPLVEQGVRDGSIKTEYPKELSEAMLILFNLWMNPFIIQNTEEELIHKIQFMKDLLERLGIPLLDDEALLALESYRKQLEEKS